MTHRMEAEELRLHHSAKLIQVCGSPSQGATCSCHSGSASTCQLTLAACWADGQKQWRVHVAKKEERLGVKAGYMRSRKAVKEGLHKDATGSAGHHLPPPPHLLRCTACCPSSWPLGSRQRPLPSGCAAGLRRRHQLAMRNANERRALGMASESESEGKLRALHDHRPRPHCDPFADRPAPWLAECGALRADGYSSSGSEDSAELEPPAPESADEPLELGEMPPSRTTRSCRSSAFSHVQADVLMLCACPLRRGAKEGRLAHAAGAFAASPEQSAKVTRHLPTCC